MRNVRTGVGKPNGEDDMARSSRSDRHSGQENATALSDAEARLLAILRDKEPGVDTFSFSVARRDGRFLILHSFGGSPGFASGDTFDEAWSNAGM